MPLSENIKSISGVCRDSGEALLGMSEVASTSSLTVAAGAVLATAWLDHVGLDAVIGDPSRLQPCLTIAVAAAILRGIIYRVRQESMVGQIASAACLPSSAAGAPISPRTSPPSSRGA